MNRMIRVYKEKRRRNRGQGMVELALTLPIFLMLVYGIFEVGRAIFMYSAVLNASRDAARYAAATGKSASGAEYYRDCSGIKSHASKVSAFVDLSATNAVIIRYDRPGDASPDLGLCPLSSGEKLIVGDRVIVTIQATFNPIVPLLNFANIPITATTTRSVVADVDIWNP